MILPTLLIHAIYLQLLLNPSTFSIEVRAINDEECDRVLDEINARLTILQRSMKN